MWLVSLTKKTCWVPFRCERIRSSRRRPTAYRVPRASRCGAPGRVPPQLVDVRIDAPIQDMLGRIGYAGCRVERVSPHTCAEVRERRAGERGEIFDVPAGRVPPELVDVPVGADVVDVPGALPGEDVAERLTRGRDDVRTT
jgi:hypothetical protein